MDLQAQTVVDGRFKIESLLGEGGNGRVYRAVDVIVQRTVALKVLQSSFLSDERQVRRFLQEGRVLSSLSHPGIVQVYKLGVWDGSCPYIAMEFVEGVTLRALIAEGRSLPLERAVDIGMQVCSALAAAHDAGIIHRDVKPENIIISNDTGYSAVKVVDFGIARLVDGDSTDQRRTKTNALIGSAFYMSPELFEGLKADRRADIYSVGCVLYEMLSGRRPYEADSAMSLVLKHTREAIPQLVERDDIKGAALRALNKVVEKSMAKEPADRYQTMNEFVRDLQLIQQGRFDQISFLPERKFGDSRVRLAALLAMVLCATSIVAAVCFNNQANSRSNSSKGGVVELSLRGKNSKGGAVALSLRGKNFRDRRSALAQLIHEVNEVDLKSIDAKSRLLILADTIKSLWDSVPPKDYSVRFQAALSLAWTYGRLHVLEPGCTEWVRYEMDALDQSSPNDDFRIAFAKFSAKAETTEGVGDFDRARNLYATALQLIEKPVRPGEPVLDHTLSPWCQQADTIPYLKAHKGRCELKIKDYSAAEASLRAALKESLNVGRGAEETARASLRCLGVTLLESKQLKELSRTIQETKNEVLKREVSSQLPAEAVLSLLEILCQFEYDLGDFDETYRTFKEIVPRLQSSHTREAEAEARHLLCNLKSLAGNVKTNAARCTKVKELQDEFDGMFGDR